VQHCFIAFELDQTVQHALRAAVEPIRRAARSDKPRFLEPPAYHITLKFLGSVDAPGIAVVSAQLHTLTLAQAPWVSHWAGYGARPRRAKAHVLAAILRDDLGRSHDLQSAVSATCARLGFAAEERPFKPHATLARFKTAIDMRRYLTLADPPNQPVPLASIALYKSTLAPEGATYEIIERFALGGEGAADSP
jgi:2'-5' RNA ligase